MIFAKAKEIFADAKVKVQFYIIMSAVNNIIDHRSKSLAKANIIMKNTEKINLINRKIKKRLLVVCTQEIKGRKSPFFVYQCSFNIF